MVEQYKKLLQSLGNIGSTSRLIQASSEWTDGQNRFAPTIPRLSDITSTGNLQRLSANQAAQFDGNGAVGAFCIA